ncbi:MAG: ABC-three component system middle component 1 [Halarcobacter sp.]
MLNDNNLINIDDNIENLKVFNENNNLIIIKKIKNINDLKNQWQDIQNFVAGKIQANLSAYNLEQNLMWNMYIIFLINKKVDKKLINDIESNKFCCKKYVVYTKDLENDDCIKKDLEEQVELFSKFDFSSNVLAISNDQSIKQKIFNHSKESKLLESFKHTDNIQNIIELEKIKDYVDKLLEEYNDEN